MYDKIFNCHITCNCLTDQNRYFREIEKVEMKMCFSLSISHDAGNVHIHRVTYEKATHIHIKKFILSFKFI